MSSGTDGGYDSSHVWAQLVEFETKKKKQHVP